jgi:SAM-dependent methyltransferase
MNYFVAAAILRVASASPLSRLAYRALTQLKSGPKPVLHGQAIWLMDALPDWDCRLLDLGTGWVHAYCLYPALLRNDEIHCFDAYDNRKFTSFVRTIPIAMEQIRLLPLAPAVLERAAERAAALVGATGFEEAYKIAGMSYQNRPTGIPDYPENYFDRIFSIDVLEHVDAKVFLPAARIWCRTLKPGGHFLAQVGIDDHLAFYEGEVGSKKYLRYSHRMWDRLLQNDVQYINRLTASDIIGLLEQAGLVIDEVKTHDCDMDRADVHPDYAFQSDEDIRAVRLFVKAHKPGR